MTDIIKLIGRIAPYYLAISIPIFIILILNSLLFIRPIDKDSKEMISFEIENDSGKGEIASMLSQKGIVRSSTALAFLLKREESKRESELILHPGEYQLSPALSPKQLATGLFDLEKISRTFSIKAGDNYKEVAQSISKSGLFTAEEILNAMTQRALLIKLRLSAGIPEGYFLPGSYTFAKPVTAEEIVESIIKSSSASIKSKIPSINERASGMKLDMYQVLTIASLIEKEGLSEAEKKNFASLLLNRLALDMPMESVPALNYGINILRGTNNPLTESDRTNNNPYNTFIKAKLPATPICSSSIESIQAVLFPNNTNYIYFKRTPEGKLSYFTNIKNFQQNIPG